MAHCFDRFCLIALHIFPLFCFGTQQHGIIVGLLVNSPDLTVLAPHNVLDIGSVRSDRRDHDYVKCVVRPMQTEHLAAGAGGRNCFGEADAELASSDSAAGSAQHKSRLSLSKMVKENPQAFELVSPVIIDPSSILSIANDRAEYEAMVSLSSSAYHNIDEWLASAVFYPAAQFQSRLSAATLNQIYSWEFHGTSKGE